MERFYTHLWKDDLSPREALWQAKRYLRGKRYPTSAWAAWVLTSQ